jgi:hypothetical protein
MRIGVDLDNTIIRYDALFRRLAEEQGLLPDDGVGSKKALRDALRLLPDGEQRWTDLQALVYGPRILEAEAFPGVEQFFRRCRELGLDLCVVSHKTEFAASDRSRSTNLRQAALSWLDAKGFFGPDLGLRREAVHFTSTRQDKTARIAALDCDLFVDDLLEVFEEPDFPQGTLKILFAPGAEDAPGDFPGLAFGHWDEVLAHVEARLPSPALRQALARELGAMPRGFRVLNGGRNSRVWRVALDTGPAVVKEYPSRQRLDTEAGAFAFLRDQGLTCVPETLRVCPDELFALYAFVPGERLQGADIGGQDVQDFVRFALELQRLAATPEAADLPDAAEAFFSLEGVLGNIGARLTRLRSRERAGILDEDLDRFLAQDFEPALARCRERAAGLYAGLGLTPDSVLPQAQRSLSPSDFGFHNALKTPQGMVFLDFEYFGRDDPAKMLADFLLHPGMGAPQEARTAFARAVLAGLGDPGLGPRLAALLPLFGLKWCMILLNEFLAADFARRTFSGERRDRAEVLRRQLDKARAMLAQSLRFSATQDPLAGT